MSLATSLLALSVLAPQSGLVGKPAPDFTLSAADGKPMRLRDLQNRGPFFLYFIRDADRVNNQIAPWLHRIFRSYVPGRAAWYGVFMGPSDRMTSWSAEFSPPYQVLLDPEMQTARTMQIDSSPTVVFVDAKGTVVRAWRGYSGYWLKDLNKWMASVNRTTPKKFDFSRTPSVTQYGQDLSGGS